MESKTHISDTSTATLKGEFFFPLSNGTANNGHLIKWKVLNNVTLGKGGGGFLHYTSSIALIGDVSSKL